MSKKKMRAFAGAMAVVLAFIPFLSGCATNEAADSPQAEQELSADEQARNEDMGSIGEGAQDENVQYGQVMAMNGSQATVVVGELSDAMGDGGSKTFESGQDEIVFDATEVSIVDESGAPVEDRTLNVDDIVVMRGTGTGSDFKPTAVEVLDVAGTGATADEGQIPPMAS